MADEVVAAVAETTAPARPKMRVKLMFSHPTNTRPKVKMAKVDGCTFFRQVVTEGRGDELSTKVAWRHVDSTCDRTDHWTYKMRLNVGGCSLIRFGREWRHEGKLCEAAMAYQVAPEIMKETETAMDRIGRSLTELYKKQNEDPKDSQVKEKIEAANKEMSKLERKLGEQELILASKPSCLNVKSDFIPRNVDGCEFEMTEDATFHHVGKRCGLKQHLGPAVGVGMVSLTRSPGRTRDEFAAKANEAIGQALALIPPNSGKHVTMEV